MKTVIILIAALIEFFSLPVWALPVNAETKFEPPKKTAYVPAELLVKYRPSVKALASRYFQTKWGITTIRTFEKIGVSHVKLPKDMTVEHALEICRGDQNVEYAEPNYYRSVLFIPNDPYFQQQWGLQNRGQEINGMVGTTDADIDAPEAWNVTPGGDDSVIAVIDSGVDITHPDLSDNIWVNSGEIPYNGIDDDGNGYRDDVWGWDFVENDNYPDDPFSHGTHVAGTIAAKGNNAIGITGVCWTVKIIPLRAFDDSGTGTVDDEIAAIEYAITNGAKIINLSLGGYEFSQSEYEAIAHARSSGVLMVAAAGNSGTDNDASPLYPASYDLDNIISVAASDQNDQLADFSNYGTTTVDVTAPGVNIFSCLPVQKESTNAEYGFKTGTSMATPHVSGIAGLIWSVNPTLSYSEVKNAILFSADRIEVLWGKMLTGGRVNAYNALLNFVTPAPSVVVPYVNAAECTTFFKVSNLGSERVYVDAEVMDDDGNRDTVHAIAKILPNVTQLIGASDLIAWMTDINNCSFAVRLIFKNGDIDTIHTTGIMKTERYSHVMPVYKTDKANADFPVVLFTPYLETSITFPTYVKINNWSENETPVMVTVRSNDGSLVDTGSLTSISAHTTNTYMGFEIASQFSIHDDSFSAEFSVYGEADKIFGVVCQQSENGEAVIPIYKNKSTTNSIYSYY